MPKQATLPPVLISKQELAQRLNVSGRTIDSWIRERKIPVIKVSPRLNRYHLGDVLLALRKFETKAKQQTEGENT